MIVNDDVAQRFRRLMNEAFFGPDWRPDQPMENLSANLEVLIMGSQITTIGDYQRAAGRLCGMREALRIFEKALKSPDEDANRP